MVNKKQKSSDFIKVIENIKIKIKWFYIIEYQGNGKYKNKNQVILYNTIPK